MVYIYIFRAVTISVSEIGRLKPKARHNATFDRVLVMCFPVPSPRESEREGERRRERKRGMKRKGVVEGKERIIISYPLTVSLVRLWP